MPTPSLSFAVPATHENLIQTAALPELAKARGYLPLPQATAANGHDDMALGFGAAGVSAGKKQATRLSDKMYKTFMKNTWFGAAMNGVGRKFNMSIEDWMSRMNTAIALYIPQVAINFIDKDGLPWETLGRNVLTWFGTIGLYAFIKNDKTSINSMFLDWFMEKTPSKNPDGTPYKYKATFKPKSFLFKPLTKPFRAIQQWWGDTIVKMQKKGALPKGLSFDPNDLYRAAGIRIKPSGLPWTRVSLEQTIKLDRMLEQFGKKFGGVLKLNNQPGSKVTNTLEGGLKEELSKFFDFFGHEEKLLDASYRNEKTGEKGLVEFSRRIAKEGPEFLKRMKKLTNWKTVINNVLFIFFIGDLVMRIVWATFAKLDKKTGHGGGKKLAPIDIAKFKKLPSRLAPLSQPQQMPMLAQPAPAASPKALSSLPLVNAASPQTAGFFAANTVSPRPVNNLMRQQQKNQPQRHRLPATTGGSQ